MAGEIEVGELLRAGDKCDASVACARRNRDQAKSDGEKGRTARNGHVLLATHAVAAFDMAGLVGDDADQLSRCVGLQNEAGVQVDILSACNEGVERWIIQDEKLHIFRTKICRFQNRVREITENVLNLRVADKALSTRRKRGKAYQQAECQGQTEKTSNVQNLLHFIRPHVI